MVNRLLDVNLLKHIIKYLYESLYLMIPLLKFQKDLELMFLFEKLLF